MFQSINLILCRTYNPMILEPERSVRCSNETMVELCRSPCQLEASLDRLRYCPWILQERVTATSWGHVSAKVILKKIPERYIESNMDVYDALSRWRIAAD